MPQIFLTIMLIAKAICLYHAIKRRKEGFWYLIILVPFGSAIYFFAEWWPELRHQGVFDHMVGRADGQRDPRAALRAAQRAQRFSDTPKNNLRVGDAYYGLQQWQQALDIYERLQRGPMKDTPDLLERIADTHLMAKRPETAIAVLNHLRDQYPIYQSHTAHMIYARAEEALERWEAARDEYWALVDYHPGEEARGRLMLVLEKMGDRSGAAAVAGQILDSARDQDDDYRRKQGVWINEAQLMRARMAVTNDSA